MKYVIVIFSITIIFFSCFQNKKVESSSMSHLNTLNMGEIIGSAFYDSCYHMFYKKGISDVFVDQNGWGHAVSSDMLNWTEISTISRPISKEFILNAHFSYDDKNNSKLSENSEPVMIIIYIYFDEGEYQLGIMYSNDKGKTWNEKSSSLDIPNMAFQSTTCPFMYWNHTAKRWVMLLSTDNSIKFYTSPNLEDWEYMSDFILKEEESEKELLKSFQFFSMKIGSNEKWILISNMEKTEQPRSRYYIGDFDQGKYNVDNDYIKHLHVLDYGKDISFSMINDSILIGFSKMSVDYTSTPRKLNLISENNHFFLMTNPDYTNVFDSEKIITLDSLLINETHILNIDALHNSPFDVLLNFDTSNQYAIHSAQKYGIVIQNEQNETITIGYDNMERVLYVESQMTQEDNPNGFDKKRYSISYKISEKTIVWHLIIDKGIVECFIDEGAISITDFFTKDIPIKSVYLYTDLGSIKLISGSICKLEKQKK